MGVIIRFRFYGYPCQSKVRGLLRRLRYHAEYSESSLLLFTLEIYHLSALLIAHGHFSLGNPRLGHYDELYCSRYGNFAIFRFLRTACAGYCADCRQQNAICQHTAVSFSFSAGGWLAPASGFPLSSIAFILIQYLSPRHSVAAWKLH